MDHATLVDSLQRFGFPPEPADMVELPFWLHAIPDEYAAHVGQVAVSLGLEPDKASAPEHVGYTLAVLAFHMRDRLPEGMATWLVYAAGSLLKDKGVETIVGYVESHRSSTQ
jgi:hypothetical protein